MDWLVLHRISFLWLGLGCAALHWVLSVGVALLWVELPNQRALIGYWTRDIHWLSKTKTQWTRACAIAFPAEFWPDKIIFFCRWLFTGLVYTNTIIHLSVGKLITGLQKKMGGRAIYHLSSRVLAKYSYFFCRWLSVNIHRYSPPLRLIIVNYTHTLSMISLQSKRKAFIQMPYFKSNLQEWLESFPEEKVDCACVCACVCVCMYLRACVRACACVCGEGEGGHASAWLPFFRKFSVITVYILMSWNDVIIHII